MHTEAHDWVLRHAHARPGRGLDIGGRNINGTCRHLFTAVGWTVLDIEPGPGVDVVADAATWTPDGEYDVVLCTEVFEHTGVWPEICATAYKACAPGGLLVLTMAGPGRAEHSAVDGGSLRAGEHYANVEPDQLRTVLTELGWTDVVVDYLHRSADTRAVARKGV